MNTTHSKDKMIELNDKQIKFLEFVILNYKQGNVFGSKEVGDNARNSIIRIFEKRISAKNYLPNSSFVNIINNIKNDYDKYLTERYMGSFQNPYHNPFSKIFTEGTLPSRNYINP
jgi:hypothetical protein